MKKTNDTLFKELKKLAKRANQRMVRLERLTGSIGTFATKQLYDYLASEPLQALTTRGRVSVRKSFSRLQMQAIIRALNKFLDDSLSTQKGLKKYLKQVSNEARFDLSYQQADVYYRASGNFKGIIDYFSSSFWDLARESVRENWSFRKFSDIIRAMIDSEKDTYTKEDLENLYEYSQGVSL